MKRDTMKKEHPTLKYRDFRWKLPKMYFLVLIAKFTILKEKSFKSSSKYHCWAHNIHMNIWSYNEILLLLAIINFLIVLC